MSAPTDMGGLLSAAACSVTTETIAAGARSRRLTTNSSGSRLTIPYGASASAGKSLGSK
jgi:hypothetical protein